MGLEHFIDPSVRSRFGPVIKGAADLFRTPDPKQSYKRLMTTGANINRTAALGNYLSDLLAFGLDAGGIKGASAISKLSKVGSKGGKYLDNKISKLAKDFFKKDNLKETKGKIIQTGDETTEGTFRYRGKTYNKSDGVLVEYPNVNPRTTRTVNRSWTPKESYGKPKDPPRVTKFTKQLDELEPIVKELFPDKNLHTIKKSFIIDALEKKGYTNIGSSTIKNLKERIMKRSPTKEEIKISKFVDDTGRPAEEYAVSTLKGKDYETAQNFIDNISVSGKQKPLLRRHLSRMITQARAKGASDAEITKILKSYDQKKLKEFFKMDEELRKLNKQASDLGINPTVAGKPYAINISHKKPTSLDWKGAFDPDNMFFSDSIGNTIKQRSIEKQIKSLREGVKKLST
jgi:hypothetical protein